MIRWQVWRRDRGEHGRLKSAATLPDRLIWSSYSWSPPGAERAARAIYAEHAASAWRRRGKVTLETLAGAERTIIEATSKRGRWSGSGRARRAA